jgi:hypothetical protein
MVLPLGDLITNRQTAIVAAAVERVDNARKDKGTRES